MPTGLRLTYDIEILSPPVKGSKDVYDFLKSVWDYELINLQEQFYILFLNNNNEIIGWRCLNTGTDSQSYVFVKMAVACSILCMASNVIVAHNHPSGNNKPSRADIFITNKLFRALDLMDIKLLDHLIISRHGYYSFVDNDHVIE